MTELNPLVTVNILSYNRKDDLRKTLNEVFRQDYKNLEVVIVDNASTDGTQEMIESEFPNVSLIKLKKNIGVSAWNEGFDAANGEFVLVLDDDSYPERGSIRLGLESFSAHKDVGVVSFQIFNNVFMRIENDINEGAKWEGNYHLGFIGCGALIKRDVFRKLNGFNNCIFLYHHEYEYSIRLYNNGLKVLYVPEARVIHGYSGTNRMANTNKIDKRRYYYCFLSYAVVLLCNFSVDNIIIYLPKLLLSNAVIGLRLGYISDYFRALWMLFRSIPGIIVNRQPVSRAVQLKYKNGNFKFYKIQVFS